MPALRTTIASAFCVNSISILSHGYSISFNNSLDIIPLLKNNKKPKDEIINLLEGLKRNFKSKIIIKPNGEKIEGNNLLRKYVI